MTAPRPIPGLQMRCQYCRQPIVMAVTVASDRNPGGKYQPLDPLENTAGNVAVRPTGRGRGVARALAGDETHDRYTEILAMPHAATCNRTPTPGAPPSPTPTRALPPGVADFDAARRARRGRP